MAASRSCWSYSINASCMLFFVTKRLIHFACAALSIKSRIDKSVLSESQTKGDEIPARELSERHSRLELAYVLQQ